MKISSHKIPPGFTISEMMVAITLCAIIMLAVVVSSVALQRAFAAEESYSISEDDQLRVQDYIAMDCRRCTNAVAQTGSWVSNSWVASPSGPITALILTVPSYYDGSGNIMAPSFVSSASSASGFAVQYNGGATTQVYYYASGTNFIRQVGTNGVQCASGATWTNCYKVIASNVNSFTVLDTDLTTTVRCTITFLPRFSTNDTASGSTTVYSNTFLRNPSAWH